jgi:two-component sensor histidine kinase
MVTPENNAELHLRATAEMGVIRALLSSLCRQVPNAPQLRAEFEQRLEEMRHAMEVQSGQKDARFDFFADLYLRSVLAPADTPRPD